MVTLRDHTELRSVTGELDVVRGLTESLRAQNHEAANRLHTVVSLIEMGRAEEAVEFATEELQVAQLLTDRVVGAVGDPVVAALLLGKSAEAAERGIELADRRRARRDSDVPARDLVTVLGNLVDNAFDARRRRRRRRVAVTPRAATPGDVVVVGRRQRPRPRRDAAAHAPRARLDHQGLRRRPAAASAWPWSRRWRGGTAATSTIGRSRLGGAEFTVTLHGGRVTPR